MSCFCKLNVSCKSKKRRVHFVKLGTILPRRDFSLPKYIKSFLNSKLPSSLLVVFFKRDKVQTCGNPQRSNAFVGFAPSSS